MRAHDGAVEHHAFHIRVVGKMGHHLSPHAVVAPARKALVDAVPVAILRGQEPPLRAAAQHPQHAFHEAATRVFLPNVDTRARPEKRQDFRPLIVA